jgi:S1-C subfamily serine protease
MTRLAFPALALATFLAPPSTPAQAEDSVALLHALDAGLVQVFEKVAPAVVVIEATKVEETDGEGDAKGFDFLFKDGEDPHRGLKDGPHGLPRMHGSTVSEGSGFTMRADGYIATNFHVIEGAEKLVVRLRDGRRLPAKLVGGDDKTDLAVVKIEAAGLAVVPLGNSEALRVGQLVGAIGAPFQQDYSFSLGVVSGKGRAGLLSAASSKLLYEDYIQTDAFINPGNSGGPLFDMDGRVVGMNTLINGIGRGLAFAIPADMLKEVCDALIATGRVHRSWLGIRMSGIENSGAMRSQLGGLEKGVVVVTVEAASPAYASELRPADVITAIDGAPVATPRDMQRAILRRPAGTKVLLGVWRAGKSLTVDITTAELPEAITKTASVPPSKPTPEKSEALGLTLTGGEAGGVLIAEVAADSPPAKAGLAPGDIITAVDAEPQNGPAAVATALHAALERDPKKGVLVNYERAGKKSWVVIERIEK